MKFTFTKKKIYYLIFFVCLILMLYSALNNYNIFNTIKKFFFEPGWKDEYFIRSDVGNPNTEPTLFNILKNSVAYVPWEFDYNIIFGTRLFQIIIPLFSLVCGIDFHEKYNTIFKFSSHQYEKYKNFLFKKIIGNATLLSLVIFGAYLSFFTIMLILSKGNMGQTDNALPRELFTDLFGVGFYIDHRVAYFFVEGFLRFFMIPFVYACFTQSCVLIFKHRKQILAAPLLYYYGFAAIGLALFNFAPRLALYITPTVIMASGDFSGINTPLIIFTNMIPLFIGLIIVAWRAKHVEI